MCQAHWCVTCPSQWGLPAFLCPSFFFSTHHAVHLFAIFSYSSISPPFTALWLFDLTISTFFLSPITYKYFPLSSNIYTNKRRQKRFLHFKKKRNSVQLILHGIKLLLWSRQPYSVGVFITASGQSLVIVTQLH